jgi:Polysaccharide lyase
MKHDGHYSLQERCGQRGQAQTIAGARFLRANRLSLLRVGLVAGLLNGGAGILIGQAARAGDVAALPHAAPIGLKTCLPVAPGAHEDYRLPPTKVLPEGVSFATDWMGNMNGGWFGIQAMDRCRMRPDNGFLTWHGLEAVRVEVQPDDDPLALHANSERAEVLIMQDGKGNQLKETNKSGTQYYATSYYLPENWQGQQLPWSAFAPLDCSADNQNRCNSWSFVWQFLGWGGMMAAQTSPSGPQLYRFNNMPFADGSRVALGKWTDFVFSVEWGSGTYRVWRRDEGGEKFALVLMGMTPVPAGKDFYIKQGLYRGGNVGGRTDVLWIGPTARGTSFAAVERQAFGTANGSNSAAH